MTVGNNAKFATDHLDVRTKSGVEWLALCPYHEDRNPSFSFNIRKGLFICYACGAKGNIEQLAKHLKVGTPESGAEEITVEEVRAKMKTLFERRESLVEDSPNIAEGTLLLSRMDNEYREQWAKRGINSRDVLDAFQLGYSVPRDALTIPLFGPAGYVVGLIYRNLSFEPKYQYPVGFSISHHLYGQYQAQCLSMGQRLKALALTEGSIDTLSMWEVGVPSVAILGARMSGMQCELIRKLDPRMLIVMTDMDTAGAKAAMEVAHMMKNTGIIVQRAQWSRSEAKDPAELSPERRVEIFNEYLT